MAGFEKVKLLTGEARADYIRKRLEQKAPTHVILAEINGPDLYSGPAGQSWNSQVVYVESRKMKPAKAAKAAAVPEDMQTRPMSLKEFRASKPIVAPKPLPEGTILFDETDPENEEVAAP